MIESSVDDEGNDKDAFEEEESEQFLTLDDIQGLFFFPSFLRILNNK